MNDPEELVMPSWAQIIEALEADPGAMTGGASPSTADLVADFPELAVVDVRDLTLDGPHGDIPARRYRIPGAEAAAALVWVHGGGFIGGDLDMPEAHWVGLTLAARGFPVLSVEYRKCLRGVRFPVPSDDVLAAWQWAVAHADELGSSPDRLHLGGASAGANLTAGVAKRLRDGAGPLPASLVLVYPLVHGVLPALSDELQTALDRIAPMMTFTPEVVRDINLQFTGSEAALADPYAFAANGDVGGQPPVFILNSEADALRASGEAYAEQLRDAGVDVTLGLEPRAGHGHLNEPANAGGQASLERMTRWLEEQAAG
jgi:acetyl esterase